MAGQRIPLEVIEGRGAKHLSKAERAAREAGEVRNPEPVKRLTPPDWLPKAQREEFNRVSKGLIALMPSMVTRLDGETIATYCMARAEWLYATGQVNRALGDGDLESADGWGRVQARLFKQARDCATDLGLTISARCRLVVPEKPVGAEDNPLVQLLERRRQA